MTAIPLQNQYLSALLPLILHTSALQLLLPHKTFWCSSTERLYTVKWQRAMTEVTLTGVTVISCTLVHKGLTGWKTITSCQVWILWCFKLPEIPQRTCYFLHRLLLSCFNSTKDETFCSLSHFGSCTLWHCCAARCVPRTPFPTHPAQPYRRGAPWTPSPRTAAPLLPMNPGEWASLDKTTWCKLLLTTVQCGQCWWFWRPNKMSDLGCIYTFSQIGHRTNGGKVFFLTRVGRRGEQNKLASQTHTIKAFLLH